MNLKKNEKLGYVWFCGEGGVGGAIGKDSGGGGGRKVVQGMGREGN